MRRISLARRSPNGARARRRAVGPSISINSPIIPAGCTGVSYADHRCPSLLRQRTRRRQALIGHGQLGRTTNKKREARCTGSLPSFLDTDHLRVGDTKHKRHPGTFEVLLPDTVQPTVTWRGRTRDPCGQAGRARATRGLRDGVVSCGEQAGARAGVLRCIQILAESAPQEDFGLTVAFLGDAIADPGGRAHSVQVVVVRSPSACMYVLVSTTTPPSRAGPIL